MAISINMEGIMAKIKTGPAAREIEKQVKPILDREFKKKKESILQVFDEHEVTQSLENGPEDDDGIVNTAHGGNLYSLLGFPAGEQPQENLRDILDDSIKPTNILIGNTDKKNTVLVSMRISVPTFAEVDKAAATKNKLPWTTRGWLSALEKGISGFGSYLFDAERGFRTSFSGTAIEAKNKKTGKLVKVRSGTFGPIKYVSEILATAKKLIRGGSDT